MSSPWGKIEKAEETNFEDIMSEEFAKGLQEKETKKYADIISKIAAKDNKETNKVEEIEGNKVLDLIPEDVLKAIAEDDDSAAGGVVSLDGFCDSDALIAHVLQNQFDHEYNEELKRIEKQNNKDAKISISLSKYRRHADDESSEEDYVDDYYDNPKKDWDRFETNEKKFDAIPKCGFKIDDEGAMITKHDPQICGVRNACRLMSFPTEFPTGDAAGFDIRLSNSVFNQLKTYSRKIKRPKMQDRKENVATAEMSVDEPTRILLYKLINNQILKQVNGIVATGKEAIIIQAAGGDASNDGDMQIPKECAIKIFKSTLNEFKQRDRYIKEDYRFKDRFSKQNKRVIINMWAEKEMHNLNRMHKIGINCPQVVTLKKHVLVMSFIGENHNAAPKLKDARLSDAELSIAYEEIIETMHKLYNEARLVHADLSEYNILWHDCKCWFIDVAQSVEPNHPSAFEFLMRDCTNIVAFFRNKLLNIKTKEELFQYITGLDPKIHNESMLERIHARGGLEKVLNAPNLDEMPDEIKPIAYPFDLAWENAEANRTKEKPILDTADALNVLSIQQPIECDGNLLMNN